MASAKLAYPQSKHTTGSESLPWLDKYGTQKPEKQIIELSREWSPDLWEQYLSWTESPRAESLLGCKRYKSLSEQQETTIYQQFCAEDVSEEIKNIIKDASKTLTEKQKYVLEMIYWHGRSERYIATSLGITQKAVNLIKQRSLNRIIKSTGVLSSRLMRREISSLVHKKRRTECSTASGKKSKPLSETFVNHPRV
jgi:DNA-directed RNA polymerase specialized sigma24 family protein